MLGLAHVGHHPLEHPRSRPAPIPVPARRATSQPGFNAQFYARSALATLDGFTVADHRSAPGTRSQSPHACRSTCLVSACKRNKTLHHQRRSTKKTKNQTHQNLPDDPTSTVQPTLLCDKHKRWQICKRIILFADHRCQQQKLQRLCQAMLCCTDYRGIYPRTPGHPAPRSTPWA